MWPAIITGFFTLVAGVAGSFGGHFYASKQKRESVRRAILAEISSIIDICEVRKYRDGMVSGSSGLIFTYTFEAPDSYRVVFDGNVGNIGLLNPNEAEKIVLFYQMAGSIVATFKPGGALTDPSTATTRGFKETLLIFDRSIALGKEIINQ